MTNDDAFRLVQTTMVELFDIAPDAVAVEKLLVQDLGLDSIDAIDMAARIQDATGKRVDDKELRAIRSVGDVVDLIVRMTAS